MDTLNGHECNVEGETTFYLEAGPKDGPLIIFLHGWPDVAETWKHQLKAFASLGFWVVAPDMRGYGKSSAPRDKRAYRLEILVKEQLGLLHHLQRTKAIWVAHDWGCGVLSALAAHHPEVLDAVCLLGVAYRGLELGLDHLVSLVNRERYPESEYPYGQWEYMKNYELHQVEAIDVLEKCGDKAAKLFYIRSNPSSWGKPGPTSRTLRDGGFLGGNADNAPDVPLEMTSLDESMFNGLAASHKKHGWFPPTAYYLNHDVNAEYDKSRKNDAVLDVPVLYLDAKFDAICSASTTPKHLDGMRKACKNLTVGTIESAHWVHLEKAREVNAALAKWIATMLPNLWPYASKVPLEKL